ncbi:MAG: hypothetical protein HZC40_26095, partial [Chloroflexi bacterium]|nr:hypothetical protein [Chloroflexota bacterium]
MFHRTLPRVFVRPLLFVFLAMVMIVFAGSLPHLTQAAGTVSLTTPGAAYTQDFNTLANTGTSSTVPTGWDFVETGSGANTIYTAGTGSATAGDTYSFGATGNTERAFGGLLSGSVVPTIGAQFTNNTGVAITSLAISYTGEMWRAGVTNRGAADRLDFQTSTDATSLTTGTWTDINNLDFSSPNTMATAGALDGNSATNRTAISYTITGLSIANGSTFWIRWSDFNITSSDDGLAVDDFSLTPNPGGIYLSINDVSVTEGNSGTTLATFTVNLSAPAGAGGVTFDIATQDNSATTANSDYVARSLTAQSIAQGNSTYLFSVTVNGDTNVEGNETFYVNVTNVVGATLSDGQGLGTINNDDTIRIRDIQGSAHISPLNGSAVANVPGIVTAVSATGFWMQDSSPDANDATSEAIFVYTASAPGRAVGDSVTVSGTVSEYRAAANANNLTLTEITAPTVNLVAAGQPVPAAIVVGTGGRIPPTTIISDDASGGNVENAGTTFDPANDGIDFWESLEGMRVQINNARAVGPSRYYASSNSWELPVVGDSGANSSVNTARGGVVIRASDYNPERILLADALNALPHDVNVGDGLGAVVGVIDYSFSNFKLYVTTTPTRTNNNLTQETTTAQTGSQFSVATLNVENLDPNDADGDTDVASGKFAGLAAIIVTNMQSPDIIAVEEIQDNNGTTNDGTVAANTTWTTLITAITTAGGPAYQYRQIDPANNADGGATGGNIRQGFLYRTDRGMAFVDRGSATATTVNSVINNSGVPQLQYSPGRIDP